MPKIVLAYSRTYEARVNEDVYTKGCNPFLCSNEDNIWNELSEAGMNIDGGFLFPEPREKLGERFEAFFLVRLSSLESIPEKQYERKIRIEIMPPEAWPGLPKELETVLEKHKFARMPD